jgi:hypothetical protein
MVESNEPLNWTAHPHGSQHESLQNERQFHFGAAGYLFVR